MADTIDSFVHLHVHSEYSMLDGLGRIKNLVKQAQKLGQPALALTDHGVMHGAIEFFRACKDGGIKPLIGIEAYETVYGRPMGGRDSQLDKNNYHLLLLARNMDGYRNLMQIASHSQLDGYYYKPRVDHDLLAKHANGLICTTGCLGAEVPNLLLQGKDKEAYERLGWYCDVFGKENFFVELQEHSIDELRPVNKQLIPWAQEFGLKLLPTNDVHYVGEKDGGPHDVLLCVQTGVTVHETKRMKMSDGSYFVKSRAQMEETFRPFVDLPGYVFDHTLQVAEMCEVDLEDPTYHLPDLPIPEGHTYDSYLRELTEEGLHRLYGERANSEAIQERKERELRVIAQMGFSIYFLIVADLCNFARGRNIWWNVRGSGAGSVVAYCIGITGLDPLKNNLIFERFLNPGRVSMPDFDLDFPDDQREEMIKYTIQRFGEAQVAQIATFNRMKAKAAVRDVGRAQGIELAKVDRIAKLIPGIPGKPVFIQDCLTEGHEFYSAELLQLYTDEQWVRELLETAKQLEGVARNSGIHAAAVIVADKDLIHYTPLMRGSKSSITSTIAQYEFPILESIGLLKVDFLGLSTLSVMREACRLIKERHGIEFTLQNIPFEGEPAKEAFKLLSSGEVSGVFQVESQGMRRVLTEMKPTMFEHIIAMISLYRPGPIEYIPQFIRRMHGEEEVIYKHPMLESILAETYAILVYQEQIIQVLSKLAGYTPGEADLVRRAISKKKASDIEKHKKIFVAGCERNGIESVVAEDIYADIEFFARYGFNKCLPGDVEVLDAATGRLVKIEDLYLQRAKIEQTVTCDTNSLKLKTGVVSAVMNNGVKPVYRLTTALGRQIETTGNHPFYTFDGWRFLEELTIGDQIATPRRLPIEGKIEWPDHEVIALGHLLAEGNLCHPHSVYFYSQDSDHCNDYIRAAESFDNVICSISVHKDTFSIYAKRIDATIPPGIFVWADRLRMLGKTATEKEIPSDVFELTNRQIGLMISRMWEGDGHINLKGRSLYYATSSKRMAHQLQHLLLRLGVISRLRTVNFSYKEGRIGYQVFVTGNENIVTFRDQIGLKFVNDYRKTLLEQLCLSSVASFGMKDVVPLAVKEIVRTEKESHKITWTQLNTDCGVAQREFYPIGNAIKSGFTRQTVQRLSDYFGSATLRRYAESDIYWDKITSIEYVGEKQTYDLEVPGTHNFVANDILVHNSHAADYAVITVQTAYLKAHYPVEYMAAQLLIERDKTEKVTNFITECRRMGIDVLPPDVTYSNLDFDIQLIPPGTQKIAQRDPSIAYAFPVPEGAAIRFGMAAIKNVGEGPVQVILEGRKTGGPFKSLEDFTQRVDLRKLNKRALECLIKVGCFDQFGKRSQLLEVIDGMVSNAAAAWDAQESGQLSIFDLFGDSDNKGNSPTSVAPIKLPDIEEVKGKEKLQWEKELLGVYSISHPLNSLGADLARVVTCSCSELDERYDGKNILLGGLITNIRTITTKKGDPMAFVQLEDLQGSCEVVFFPKTYAELKDQLLPDTVMLIKGKAQAREGRTSLLADSIQRYIDKAIATGQDPSNQYQKPLLDTPTINGVSISNGMNLGGTNFGMNLGRGAGIEGMMNGGDDAEFVASAESSSFMGDMPAWLGDVPPPPLDDDDELFDGEPLPLVKLSSPPPGTVATPVQKSTSNGSPSSNGAGKPPVNTQPVNTQPVNIQPVDKMTESAPTYQTKTGSPPAPAPKSLPDTSLVWYDFDARKEMEDARRQEARAQGDKERGRQGEGETERVISQPIQQVSNSEASVSTDAAAEQGNKEIKKDGSQPAAQVLANEASVSTDAVFVDAAGINAITTAAMPVNVALTTPPAAQEPIPVLPTSEEVVHRKPATPANGQLNRHASNGNGANSNGTNGKTRHMRIALRRSGDIERDKYRLKQIYDAVCDPRGRDHFSIKLVSDTQNAELSFPNDGCTISDKLTGELTKHYRVEVEVEE